MHSPSHPGTVSLQESRVRREFSRIEGFSSGTHGLNAVVLPEAGGFTVASLLPLPLLLGGVLFELAVEQALGYVRVSAGGGQR